MGNKISVRRVGASLSVYEIDPILENEWCIYASENLQAFEDWQRFEAMTGTQIKEFCDQSGWNAQEWASRPLDWEGLWKVERLARQQRLGY